MFLVLTQKNYFGSRSLQILPASERERRSGVAYITNIFEMGYQNME